MGSCCPPQGTHSDAEFPSTNPFYTRKEQIVPPPSLLSPRNLSSFFSGLPRATRSAIFPPTPGPTLFGAPGSEGSARKDIFPTRPLGNTPSASPLFSLASHFVVPPCILSLSHYRSPLLFFRLSGSPSVPEGGVFISLTPLISKGCVRTLPFLRKKQRTLRLCRWDIVVFGQAKKKRRKGGFFRLLYGS